MGKEIVPCKRYSRQTTWMTPSTSRLLYKSIQLKYGQDIWVEPNQYGIYKNQSCFIRGCIFSIYYVIKGFICFVLRFLYSPWKMQKRSTFIFLHFYLFHVSLSWLGEEDDQAIWKGKSFGVSSYLLITTAFPTLHEPNTAIYSFLSKEKLLEPTTNMYNCRYDSFRRKNFKYYLLAAGMDILYLYWNF